MAVRTVFKTVVAERSTARYSARLVDEAGLAISSSALTTLKLTIFNNADSTVLNGVERTDILNTDRGTVDGSGNLVITLNPEDNVIVDTDLQIETHILFIEWTYGTEGNKAGNHEIEFPVYNRNKLPVSAPLS